MEGSVERVSERMRILPPLGRDRQMTRREDRPPFKLHEEKPDTGTNQPQEESRTEDRPVGHAPDDEAGAHLDVTA